MTERTDEHRSDGSSESDKRDTSTETASVSPTGTDSSNERASETAVGETSADRERPTDLRGWFQRFRTAESGPMLYARDLVTSVLIVLIIGSILFGISGVWPPMVAIESGSMEPNMNEGDLVFVVDNERFVPDSAITNDGQTTGVVPADIAQTRDRTKFGAHGDVIVFRPNGNTGRTPVIHRTMFWVEDGEDWYDRADPDALGGADNCDELNHCPAPNAGFITKGDNELTNENYDQVMRLSAPVRPEWIVGTAEVRIPYLGHIRLVFATLGVDALDVSSSADPDFERAAPERTNNTSTTHAVS